jgi:hypothetical protein
MMRSKLASKNKLCVLMISVILLDCVSAMFWCGSKNRCSFVDKGEPCGEPVNTTNCSICKIKQKNCCSRHNGCLYLDASKLEYRFKDVLGDSIRSRIPESIPNVCSSCKHQYRRDTILWEKYLVNIGQTLGRLSGIRLRMLSPRTSLKRYSSFEASR